MESFIKLKDEALIDVYKKERHYCWSDERPPKIDILLKLLKVKVKEKERNFLEKLFLQICKHRRPSKRVWSSL